MLGRRYRTGEEAVAPARLRARLRAMLVTALMGVLVVVLGMTPAGFVPVPTPAGAATTMHIPVILAALVQGPVAGAVTGLLFGAFSFWRALVAAGNPVARMMFSDPLVAFGPRILIGVVAYLAFRASSSRAGRWIVALGVAAAVGDGVYRITSRIPTSVEAPYPGVTLPGLLLSLAAAGLAGWAALGWLASRDVGPALGALAGSLTNTVGVLGLSVWRAYLPWQVALGIGILHGLPEALVATVLTVAVYRGLQRAGVVPRPSATPPEPR